jgi:hypothetical protein
MAYHSIALPLFLISVGLLEPPMPLVPPYHMLKHSSQPLETFNQENRMLTALGGVDPNAHTVERLYWLKVPSNNNKVQHEYVLATIRYDTQLGLGSTTHSEGGDLDLETPGKIILILERNAQKEGHALKFSQATSDATWDPNDTIRRMTSWGSKAERDQVAFKLKPQHKSFLLSDLIIIANHTGVLLGRYDPISRNCFSFSSLIMRASELVTGQKMTPRGEARVRQWGNMSIGMSPPDGMVNDLVGRYRMSRTKLDDIVSLLNPLYPVLIDLFHQLAAAQRDDHHEAMRLERAEAIREEALTVWGSQETVQGQRMSKEGDEKRDIGGNGNGDGDGDGDANGDADSEDGDVD